MGTEHDTTTSPPAASTDPAADPQAPGPAGHRAGPHQVQRTRFSALWVSALLFALVLMLLLVFILENSRKVDIAYFGAHTHLPLGVALLLATVCGILLVAIPGTGRILQLRATARRHR
jgi:lipopolysaccharide assembly protein A